jgi:plastocyanin
MLQRVSLVLTLLGVALFAVASVSARTGKDKYDLKGEVYGDSQFKIEMKNSANRDLKTVKAGTYRIKIEDKGATHNFHLMGPGVDKSTSIAGKGDTIWTVKLKPGKYTYVCDAHVAAMKGSFRVT